MKKIAVLGGGQVGSSLAKILTDDGNDITLIDNDLSTLNDIQEDNDIKTIQIDNGNYIVDSGSPHFITFKDNIENLDVESEGRSIRNIDKFSKDGINVNFVSLGNSIRIRTYERGVESETLSCGTGAVAASIPI